tara:strand:+ start:981 stop:2009 length:1029 start_codon:yes stop_codon:yes gene_type:complete
MKTHEYFMEKCIDLAKKGIQDVSPNPMVGSIIVYNDEIIGQGYHEKYGSNHAEVNAINSVQDKSLLEKSTLYVNLEPCCHHGKTPPCTNLIIEKKIPKVVIGCKDSYSKVSGNGIKKLRNNLIEVIDSVLDKKCKELNRRFFSFHEKKRPYIILKWAKSKDNYIAPINQDKPFWMTCEKSKELVHRWRAQEDSILVGRKTVIADNPLLTVRLYNGKNPVRIIIDKNLTINQNLKIYNKEANTIILNQEKSLIDGKNIFVKIDFNNFLENMLNELYNRNILSVIVEGGAETINSFINRDLFDEIRVFTTTKILKNGIISPNIPKLNLLSKNIIDKDILEIFRR